jgi:hypothetical protein
MSEEWISARDAREKVVPGCRHNDGRTDVILQRAKAGLVKARASVFKSTKAGVKSDVRDHPIPADFWGGNSLKQNWTQGDFSTWIHSEGWETYCEAYGVTFEQSGIEAMAHSGEAATAPSQSQVPDHVRKGGNPGKYDWAKAVGTVIFEWSESGLWQPESQGEIKAKLADWFSEQNQTPDDSQLRKYARWLFGEFKKRKSAPE